MLVITAKLLKFEKSNTLPYTFEYTWKYLGAKSLQQIDLSVL